MSLRFRPLERIDHPAIAWSDTISALAEVHRTRRSVDETSRWPLAHRCTAETVHGRDAQAMRPFCCRALA